jgi:YihY family inner membrane protein
VLERIDRWQQRRRIVGFPIAVGRRYGEDHGGWLGAIVTYYGFFALAPLLALLMTIVTTFFGDEPSRRDRMVEAINEVLPFAGEGIQQSLAPIVGSPWAVIAGAVVALWGGINVMRVGQDTTNRMWGVPRYRRPGMLRAVGRGIVVLGLLAVGLLMTTIIAGLTLGRDFPLLTVLATGAASCVTNTVITVGLFRLLASRRLSTRDVLPGAVVVGVGTYGLTLVGGLYVQHVVAGASSLYGSFATMVGLFAWIALVVQTVVIGTLVNVVRVEQLWPRSLTGAEPTAGDDRAADLIAQRVVLRAPVERLLDRP